MTTDAMLQLFDRAIQLLTDEVARAYKREGSPLGRAEWVARWPEDGDPLGTVGRIESELNVAGVECPAGLEEAIGRVHDADELRRTVRVFQAGGRRPWGGWGEGTAAVLSLSEGLSAVERIALVLLGDDDTLGPAEAWQAAELLNS